MWTTYKLTFCNKRILMINLSSSSSTDPELAANLRIGRLASLFYFTQNYHKIICCCKQFFRRTKTSFFNFCLKLKIKNLNNLLRPSFCRSCFRNSDSFKICQFVTNLRSLFVCSKIKIRTFDWFQVQGFTVRCVRNLRSKIFSRFVSSAEEK